MASRELRDTGVTANVLVPGGLTNTDLIPDGGPFAREDMIQPEVMQAPIVWLASTASDDVTGQRFIAYHWDEDLPLEERLVDVCFHEEPRSRHTRLSGCAEDSRGHRPCRRCY